MEEEKSLNWGKGFQKSEALVLAEKIYDCKCEINDLEWKLDDEEFHFKYVLKRKERVVKQVWARMAYIIPFSVMIIFSILLVIVLSLNIGVARGKGEIDGSSTTNI